MSRTILSLQNKIKELEAELKLYHRQFCEAHQPIPDEEIKQCPCCAAAWKYEENQQLEAELKDKDELLRQIYIAIYFQPQSEFDKVSLGIKGEIEQALKGKDNG